ncbi:MAG: T9SS type A sorting domain-containing protein, partial [Gloeobacteraceae cyanobacterium ES-bin-316]|nr:T9SS type A sorting domain-containing protein [Ferruginibacter sp.]
ADPALKYKNAFTDDVRTHMEALSGLDLSRFFSDWIYNRGFANYNTAKWNSSGNQLILLLPQATEYSPLSSFEMPVVVRVQGSNPVTMDTTIVLYDKQGILHTVNNGVLTSTGANLVQFNLSFAPTTISFDPFRQVLANGSIMPDPTLTILATKLLSFTGNKEGKNARLLWAIDDAYDYHSFELERSSDAQTFNKITTLKSLDNAGKFNFDFTDYNLPIGINYYRLKVKQHDGSFIYSKTIIVENKYIGGTFIITPNPASGFININWAGNPGTKITAKLFDTNGRLVKTVSRPTIAANTIWKIPVNELQAGNYFVEIEGSNKEKSIQKIVIIQ